MENSLKGLILAAGTIITCVVITLAFYISREAKQTAANGAQEINKLNTEFAESDKIIYDNAIVSGSEVVNAIKKMAGEKVGVCVETSASSKPVYYGYEFDVSTGKLGDKEGSYVAAETEEGSETYINPYASFKGTIIRDSNDVITGIRFVQS